MLNLRPYQVECLQAIQDNYVAGERRQLVSLPTGSGKTVIFANLIKRTGARSLVLAHTNELLSQAKDKIKMIAPDLDVGIVNAEHKQFNSPVVVSSLQSARLPKNLNYLKQQKFNLLVADEAHHFAADSPKMVLDELGFSSGSSRLLVGFTATPFRNDEKGLGGIFDVITYQKNTKDLIEAGYLCRPKGIRVATDLDLSKVKISDGDFQATSLSSVMDTPEINQLIVDSYTEKALSRKAICFGVTVQHARNLANLFRSNGIKAKAVYGSMPKTERDKSIDDYRKGKLDVLCNCQLLTEGFDAPETSCIIVGRPTQSKGIYMQIVGRGLRLFPNKRDCLILDFGSKSHNLCSAALLLQDIEKIEAQERQEKKRKKEILSTLPPSLNQKLKSALVEFDPLGESFNWALYDNVYFLKGIDGVNLRIIPTYNERYKVFLTSNKGNQLIADGLNFEYAFATGEDFAKQNRKTFTLSDKEAPWRHLPASQKQIEIIKSKKFRSGLDTLTRGQASDLIGSGALKRTRH